MNDREAATRYLRGIAEEHRGDRDAGESLVKDFDRELKTAAPLDRKDLAAALADLVRQKDEHLWACALDGLVHAGEASEIAALAEEVSRGKHDPDWRDMIVFALLKLRQNQHRALIIEQARTAFVARRIAAAGIISSLCYVDRGAWLELASAYLGETADSEWTEGLLAPFVSNAAALDDGLLPLLVQKDRKSVV